MPHVTDPSAQTAAASAGLTGRTRRLARRVLPTLLDPAAAAADRMAAARILDRAQTAALTGCAAPEAVLTALLRRLAPAPGPRLGEALIRTLPEPVALEALRWAPGLEPIPRGPRRFRPAPLSAPTGRPHRVRQGRLGDCWLVAVMAACELTQPGFLRRLIADGRTASSDAPVGAGRGPASGSAAGLVAVDLFSPALAVAGLRRLPLLPVRRRRTLVSTRVPVRHRAGDGRGRPSAASLVEKAAVLVWAGGSYRRLQNDFAGIGFLLLTGRWCPARPVPGTVERLARWLREGRPVVLSTLVRPGGSFTIEREDGAGRVALMDAHVYVGVRVLRCTEDGRPDRAGTLRLHVRNPVGGREAPRLRRTDLYLSATQIRRAFISVNVGPALG